MDWFFLLILGVLLLPILFVFCFMILPALLTDSEDDEGFVPSTNHQLECHTIYTHFLNKNMDLLEAGYYPINMRLNFTPRSDNVFHFCYNHWSVVEVDGWQAHGTDGMMHASTIRTSLQKVDAQEQRSLQKRCRNIINQAMTQHIDQLPHEDQIC